MVCFGGRIPDLLGAAVMRFVPLRVPIVFARPRYASSSAAPPSPPSRPSPAPTPVSAPVSSGHVLYKMGVQPWHRFMTAATFAQATVATVLGPLVLVMPSELLPKWQAYAVSGFIMSASLVAFAGWQTLLKRLVLHVIVSDDEKSVRLAHYTAWCTVKWREIPIHTLTMDVLRTKLVRNTKFYSVSEIDESTNRARTYILPKDPAFCSDFPRLEFVLNGNEPYVPPGADEDDQSKPSSS